MEHLKKQHFLTSIFNLLNKNSQYAILRNYDNLPDDPGRDIDVLIDKRDFKNIISEFISTAEKYGYKLFLADRRQYMYFIVFGRIGHSNHVDLISFDFIFTLHIRSMRLFKTKDILKNRIFNGKIYHVRKDYEFLSKYLYCRLLNAKFPDKYINLKQATLSYNKSVLQSTLHSVFAKNVSFEDIDKGYSSHLKYLFYSSCIRKQPLEFCSDVLKYYYFNIKRLLKPQGIAVGFTGPDGIGKTTIINNIISIISQATTVSLFHHRPNLLGNLSNVAHQAGLKKDIDDDYSNPHRSKPKGFLNSFMRLLYYSLDYTLGFHLKIKKRLSLGGVVIFDRYFSDIIVDSSRSSIFLNHRFLYHFGKLFIPKLNHIILLTADPYIILSRKKELNEEEIVSINNKLCYLEKKGYKKFMNDKTPADAVAQVFNYILNVQHQRIIQRFK